MTKPIQKIKNLWEDKTGVSPIIAVILMVAITVVLAATIYVWVSGFGGGGEEVENAAVVVKGESGPQIRFLLSSAGDNAPYANYTEYSIYVDGSLINITTEMTGGQSDGDWDAGESLIFESTSTAWDASWEGESVAVSVEIMGDTVFDRAIYIPTS